MRNNKSVSKNNQQQQHCGFTCIQKRACIPRYRDISIGKLDRQWNTIMKKRYMDASNQRRDREWRAPDGDGKRSRSSNVQGVTRALGARGRGMRLTCNSERDQWKAKMESLLRIVFYVPGTKLQVGFVRLRSAFGAGIHMRRARTSCDSVLPLYNWKVPYSSLSTCRLKPAAGVSHNFTAR
jgi:hypothetical protein